MELPEINFDQDKQWHSIAPDKEIPEGVSTWMVEVPNEGKLFVNLNDTPGSSAHADEDEDRPLTHKAYVLSSETPGLAVNGEELLAQGFKTLDIAFTPNTQTDLRRVELGIRGSALKFIALLQRNDDTSPLKPLSYWARENDSSKYPAPRDIMIKPQDIKNIRVKFTEGGDN